MQNFHPAFENLPNQLALFPLPNVLLLPEQILPLNVFEDRYIQMFEDVMAQGRMLGLIQPRKPNEEEMKTQVVSGHAPLFETGCMGRVTQFEETSDGRFSVQIRGVCRFKIIEEVTDEREYRQANVAWEGYKGDLINLEKAIIDLDTKKLVDLLRQYFKVSGMNMDMGVIENMPLAHLVSALAMICPFGPMERQAMLEVGTLQERGEMLVTLLEMAVLNDTHAGGAA